MYTDYITLWAKKGSEAEEQALQEGANIVTEVAKQAGLAFSPSTIPHPPWVAKDVETKSNSR